MTLSETKLEAHERRADLAGLSLCDYLERAPRDLKVAQDKLRGEEETEHRASPTTSWSTTSSKTCSREHGRSWP